MHVDGDGIGEERKKGGREEKGRGRLEVLINTWTFLNYD